MSDVIVKVGDSEDNQGAFAIGITKVTIDRILQLRAYRADALALYLFYAYTARWQGRTQLWANTAYASTSYTAKGLDWSERKVQIVKKELETLGLIQNIQQRNKESSRVERWLISINFLARLTGLRERRSTPTFSVGVDNSAPNVEEETLKKKREKKEGNFSVDFVNPELQAEWEAWQLHRRQIRKPLSEITRGRQVRKLSAMGKERALAALRHSMENGWEGIFEGPALKSRPPIPMSARNKRINQLNQRKAELMRLPDSPDRRMKLEQIRIELCDL